VNDLRTTACWGGAFGASETGLPVIGRVPGSERVMVAAGFGGNGITHAMLAARLIAADLGGRPAADAALYAPPGPNA
jgi:glycine/D-amino acid oxidase-like deaminating enzyme